LRPRPRPRRSRGSTWREQATVEPRDGYAFNTSPCIVDPSLSVSSSFSEFRLLCSEFRFI
jgi:hypothetical protein